MERKQFIKMMVTKGMTEEKALEVWQGNIKTCQSIENVKFETGDKVKIKDINDIYGVYKKEGTVVKVDNWFLGQTVYVDFDGVSGLVAFKNNQIEKQESL